MSMWHQGQKYLLIEWRDVFLNHDAIRFTIYESSEVIQWGNGILFNPTQTSVKRFQLSSVRTGLSKEYLL